MIPKIMYNKWFIAVFCVLAVASLAFIGSIDNAKRDLERTSVTIHDIASDESLYRMVSRIGAEPTLLVLYTSWCSNCIEKMPDVIKIIDTYRDRITPIIVSLDTNKSRLASFLLEQSTINFVPYNVSPHYHGKLVYALTGKGIYFEGRIPFIAVLGNNSAPISGIGNMRSLRTALESIFARQNNVN